MNTTEPTSVQTAPAVARHRRRGAPRVIRLCHPHLRPPYAGLAMLWAFGGALVIIVWWLLLSRARWYERLGAIVLMIAAVIPEKYVVHPSMPAARWAT